MNEKQVIIKIKDMPDGTMMMKMEPDFNMSYLDLAKIISGMVNYSIQGSEENPDITKEEVLEGYHHIITHLVNTYQEYYMSNSN